MDTYLFTSESVSEGHPDKVADQISDAILDEFLRQDPESKVACESFCSTGMVVVMGEVHSKAYVDIQSTVRDTIRRIGYTKAEYMFDASSCGVLSALHEQSEDIHRGVERGTEELQGAGDQGIMFGYACKDTEDYMPLPLYLSHKVLEIVSRLRHTEPEVMPYLRPDAKSQFTIAYDAHTHRPLKVHTLVLSLQHDEFVPTDLAEGLSYAEAVERFGQGKVDEAMQAKIRRDVEEILLPRLREALPGETAALLHDFTLHVNPTGKFVIGGPHGDTGLTGRKIIVDTYGGKGAHGGGAFSGKDPSKVDRSAAYAARYIAKHLVASGMAEECLVQLSYAIGVAEPVSVFVDTYGTAREGWDDAAIARALPRFMDLRPGAIIRKFQLKNPIYLPTAAYGHMGRKPYTGEVLVQGEKKTVQFFGWEKLDGLDEMRKLFGL